MTLRLIRCVSRSVPCFECHCEEVIDTYTSKQRIDEFITLLSWDCLGDLKNAHGKAWNNTEMFSHALPYDVAELLIVFECLDLWNLS